MKRFFFLFFVIVPFILFGQSNSYSLSKVISADSVSKDKLYLVLKTWIVENYKSANKVLQMDDKENGILICKGNVDYCYGTIKMSCTNGYVEHCLKIEIKDGRFKITFFDFNHAARPSSSYTNCSIGLITTDEIYPVKSVNQNWQTKIWKDIKTKMDATFIEICASIEQYIQKSNEPSNDW